MHIDCTETGASPPTKTEPTFNCRVFRRGAKVGGGADGIPKSTMGKPYLEIKSNRVEDIGSKQQ
ncbi:unannotated protein [freshwater metagenome]|uniref:Unannotated protein n=1 Tax=freshwater metagenome TaxID=449393 RepID=A0A6J6VDW9_9ZZZZ